MTLQPDRAQADESSADPFDRLFNGDARFCVWKTEIGKKGKSTKVPYQAVGKKGSSSNPHSWIARPKAEELVHGGGQFDGIGIYLGDLPDGRVLAGIDLDTCRDDTSGGAEDWAEEVIRQFDSYAEVSPSLTGYKIFFLIEAADRECVLALLDGGEGKRGAQWKLRASGGHPPAIELYTGGRYFTITHKRVAQMPDEIRSVPYDMLRWLIEEHGPAFSRGQECRNEQVNGHASEQKLGEPEADDSEEDEAEGGESGADDADLETRGKAALACLAEFGRKRKGLATLKIAALLRGDASYLNDGSRSAFDFVLVGYCKDAGFAKGDAQAALYAFEHGAGREHHDAGDRRYFARCWKRTREDQTFQQPAQEPLTARDPAPHPLDDVLAYLRRFIAYPSEHAALAHALWIVHTHLMDAWDSTPRIAFLSPEPGSGKSRALEVSELLVPGPVNAVNVSVAYLFRRVGDEQGRPTILYDEVDTVFTARGDNEDIRALINAGHRRHSVVGRCVVHGKRIETEETPAYCAIALAGLGDLPDTILTRSIVVRMRRRAPTEQVAPYRRRDVEGEAADLSARIAAWCAGVRQTVQEARPEFPAGVADRDADVWEALLAIADVAGGDWPARTRRASAAMVAQAKEGTPSLGVRLLADVRTAFGERDRISTEELLRTLHAMDEAPWADLRGKALEARGLAARLKPYSIASKTVRLGASTAKGYERADLADAWARYLPPLPLSPQGAVTSVTSVTPIVSHDDAEVM